jgi:hypothetical protein
MKKISPSLGGNGAQFPQTKYFLNHDKQVIVSFTTLSNFFA